MEIINVIEVGSTLSKSSVFVGIVAIIFYVLTIIKLGMDADVDEDKLKKIRNISLIIALIGLVIIPTVDNKVGEKKVEYEAIVTEVDEVEKKGYEIIEHKADNIYILEKSKK